MRIERLQGNTLDLAEIIVDYKNKKTEFKGIEKDTIYTRLKSAFRYWCAVLFFPFAAILAFFAYKEVFDPFFKVLSVYAFTIAGLTLCHLNKKFDFMLRKLTALRTGNGERNRIKVKDFRSNQFVIYNTKNIAVDYEAEGEVGEKLQKIWIKKEHAPSVFMNQATVEDIFLLENKEYMWNVYFIFDDAPKTGSLTVEWI